MVLSLTIKEIIDDLRCEIVFDFKLNSKVLDVFVMNKS